VVQTLDTRDAVLTLTAADAERAGLGVIHGGSAAELGEVLGLAYNRGASKRAEAIRHRHATALQEAQQNAIAEAKRIANYREELVDLIPALRDVIRDATSEAESIDPS